MPDGAQIQDAERFAGVLSRLSAVIEARKGGDPAASHTSKLLADPALAAKQRGEEAVETLIAACRCPGRAPPRRSASSSADAGHCSRASASNWLLRKRLALSFLIRYKMLLLLVGSHQIPSQFA